MLSVSCEDEKELLEMSMSHFQLNWIITVIPGRLSEESRFYQSLSDTLARGIR